MLVRAVVDEPTKAGGLTVDAELGLPSAPQLHLARKASRAGLTLAAPGSGGRARMAVTAGQARASAEAYAYFSGGLVLAKGLHALSKAAIRAISGQTETTVSFSPAPAELLDLAVGDVLSDPVGTATRHGFLRRVVRVTRTGSTLVVETEEATVKNAVARGHISWGGHLHRAGQARAIEHGASCPGWSRA